MTGDPLPASQPFLIPAAHRLATAACLLLAATAAADQLHLDHRYVLAAAFVAAQLGAVAAYVPWVWYRRRGGSMSREARGAMWFNLFAFFVAAAWMAVPHYLARRHR